jgi:hypothetical protein
MTVLGLAQHPLGRLGITGVSEGNPQQVEVDRRKLFESGGADQHVQGVEPLLGLEGLQGAA